MCDSFAQSQEKLLASKLRPDTSDMQVQCEPERDGDIISEKSEKVSPRYSVSPRKLKFVSDMPNVTQFLPAFIYLAINVSLLRSHFATEF